jgi:hypothetical protein
MNVTNTLLSLINGYKTYSTVILAVVSGMGMILSKNYDGGIATICQALLLVFGGASIVGLRHAVAKVPHGVIDAASRHT